MAEEAGENIIDARDAAESAGLVYIDYQGSGITRRRSGKGWSYRDATGAKISDKALIEQDRHPARLHRRVDLRRLARPHPSDRLRCQGPQAVPLPRAFPRSS